MIHSTPGESHASRFAVTASAMPQTGLTKGPEGIEVGSVAERQEPVGPESCRAGGRGRRSAQVFVWSVCACGSRIVDMPK